MEIYTEGQVRAMDRERLIKMVLVQQQKLSDINSKLQVMLQKMELYRQGQNTNNMLR